MVILHTHTSGSMSIVSNKWRLTRDDPDLDAFLSRSSHHLKVDVFTHQHHGSFKDFLDRKIIDFINGNRIAGDFMDGIIIKTQGASSYDLRDSITLSPQPGLKLTYLVRLVKLLTLPLLLHQWKFHYVVIACVLNPDRWCCATLSDISRGIVSSTPYNYRVEEARTSANDDHHWSKLFGQIETWQAEWESGHVRKSEVVGHVSVFFREFPEQLRQQCFNDVLSLVGDLEHFDGDDLFGKRSSEDEGEVEEQKALVRQRTRSSRGL